MLGKAGKSALASLRAEHTRPGQQKLSAVGGAFPVPCQVLAGNSNKDGCEKREAQCPQVQPPTRLSNPRPHPSLQGSPARASEQTEARAFTRQGGGTVPSVARRRFHWCRRHDTDTPTLTRVFNSQPSGHLSAGHRVCSRHLCRQLSGTRGCSALRKGHLAALTSRVLRTGRAGVPAPAPRERGSVYVILTTPHRSPFVRRTNFGSLRYILIETGKLDGNTQVLWGRGCLHHSAPSEDAPQLQAKCWDHKSPRGTDLLSSLQRLPLRSRTRLKETPRLACSACAFRIRSALPSNATADLNAESRRLMNGDDCVPALCLMAWQRPWDALRGGCGGPRVPLGPSRPTRCSAVGGTCHRPPTVSGTRETVRVTRNSAHSREPRRQARPAGRGRSAEPWSTRRPTERDPERHVFVVTPYLEDDRCLPGTWRDRGTCRRPEGRRTFRLKDAARDSAPHLTFCCTCASPPPPCPPHGFRNSGRHGWRPGQPESRDLTSRGPTVWTQPGGRWSALLCPQTQMLASAGHPIADSPGTPWGLGTHGRSRGHTQVASW
ncbi:uncharacterized protein AAES06_013459 [Glossophaga mutica]